MDNKKCLERTQIADVRELKDTESKREGDRNVVAQTRIVKMKRQMHLSPFNTWLFHRCTAAVSHVVNGSFLRTAPSAINFGESLSTDCE